MIELRHVSYSYGSLPVIRDITLTIKEGESVAIIGSNAAGKSTLARLLNALILPDEGQCLVDGRSTKDVVYFARKTVGMVFQNPEDQIVSKHVLDDIAFGLLNLGFTAEEAMVRANETLGVLGIDHLSRRSTHGLSGGQKQLIAIAGVLAMRPRYIILDEPTALLDGDGARLVHTAIEDLKKNGISIILITHDMEEALLADRIILLCSGKVLAQGTPEEVFSRESLLSQSGVEAPFSLQLRNALRKKGLADVQVVKSPCQSR